MHQLFDVDWASIFLPGVPILETVVRGTAVYFALFFMLRLVLKRQAGAVGVTDLLVVVLIADAAQNAMAANYKSIPDGILLVATIIFWSFAFDWVGYRHPRFQRFVHPPPLPLVKNGEILWRNMRKELITKGELMTQLRQQGVNDLKSVRLAYMEGDGYISVITIDAPQSRNQKRERHIG